MPDIGPTVEGGTIGYWIAQLKASGSVAANPIGATAGGHKSHLVAKVEQEAAIKDVGPTCEAYDPDLAALFSEFL